ncbi:MAG: transporter substrate-binding domain-containing protein [Atopobiaceae bacterium]|nr:transporter substrate-binding domain-containing protein [Atopobiaceae bacterium]
MTNLRPTTNQSVRTRFVWQAVLLLFVALLASFMLPTAIRAEDTAAGAEDETADKEKIVRVGWFESQFNITDEKGRRSGYSYDYQQKIAAYTGWTYEYVEGSWPELLQMLSEGRIDLLSDVSYTDERAEQMLFSTLPMGAEEYFLYASPKNNDIVPNDYATFNGKKVGVNKGSVQTGIFLEWAQANGIQAELVELTGTEEENLTSLAQGKIDLYLSLDGFFDKGTAVPVCKIGASDFFFAVSKSRPELLAELNQAMGCVQDENQQYHQQLTAKYLRNSSVSRYLNATELDWLEGHDAIRVGYQDNYLAFCAKDPETGELTGALADYLATASDCLENAHIDFEPICYPTFADAIKALQGGEVDCVFPANLTEYDGETRGLLITPPLMSTDMAAVIREADQKSFAKKERVTVAVNADNPNYDLFLMDHFPEWRAIYFADTQECLRAIADGQADCLLISSYRYNNISALCEKLHLTTLSTGIDMDYCFAVNRGDTLLYSILAKATSAMSASTVNAALAHYYTEDARIKRIDPNLQNLMIIAICILTVAVVTLAFLLRDAWKERESARQQGKEPTKEDFALLDNLPLSYSVYHVIHTEHSKLYDAEIVYANHQFEQLGGMTANAIVGHRVRELYPYIQDEWYQSVKRAAVDGEDVEYDYHDPLNGKNYHFTAKQVIRPGYCAVTYQEV